MWLGTIYRLLQDSVVDMERMFKLLKLRPEVEDKPDAPPLQVSRWMLTDADVC
jgi:ABC-type transport system involved in Fe-S cluster assembly fused permease/ATPase subunit